MTSFGKPTTGFAFAALLATTACATGPAARPQPLSRPLSEPATVSIGGYLLGDLLGGRRERIARILRAGIGGLPSPGIGAYMDRQERELRARTDGTAIRVTRQGDDLILTIPSGITFAYNSDSVAPGFERSLDAVAGVLHAYDRAFVDVYGHSDATGSDAFNQGLSERRAASVAASLVAHGVDRARVETRGFGKSQPIESNDTLDGQAANRRVEIKIVPIAETDLR